MYGPIFFPTNLLNNSDFPRFPRKFPKISQQLCGNYFLQFQDYNSRMGPLSKWILSNVSKLDSHEAQMTSSPRAIPVRILSPDHQCNPIKFDKTTEIHQTIYNAFTNCLLPTWEVGKILLNPPAT